MNTLILRERGHNRLIVRATRDERGDFIMTRLYRAVRRESLATLRELGKDRAIIVTMRPPNIIALRLKGTRREYTLTAQSAYAAAVLAHVEYERREKRAARKAKRATSL